MSLINCAFLLILLIGTELLYLKIARSCRVFDLPGERSLHQNTTTVRGGGIVVYLAVLTTFLTGSFTQVYFFGGLTAVALVSFLDDLYGVATRFRFLVQLLGVSLLLVQTGFFPVAWWVVPGLLVVGTGILNTCNFMDGINGMTVFYGLISIGTIGYLQHDVATSDSVAVYPAVVVALLVFGFFNARPKAVCFAGDVGSIGLGFILLYGLVTLINEHHTYLPLLLLAVYGTDSVLTIMYRVGRGQSIFRAHRQHLYQLLVSRRGWPHLSVAAIYAGIQMGINGLVMWAMDWSSLHQVLLAGLVLSSLVWAYVTGIVRLTG